MSDTYDQQQDPAGGRRVGAYELLDEIGAGGMSRVYRARHIPSGGIVAVKVMLVENTAADFEARLRREPEIQQGIGHANIVHLIESFRERDEFFLVMEYVDGRSLASVIHQEAGPLPLDRVRGYMRQILRAVDHLHRLGIIHRDIKPSNILIDRSDVAKLADFGIAKYAWQQAQTSTQRGIGTPEYMSPEQARGEQVDIRTDVYSLGITLFEALTGRRPFARAQASPAAYGEVIQEILSRPLPDPRSFNPAVTPQAVRLLVKATEKNPADRFQSCAEFLGALEIVGVDDDRPAASPRMTAIDSTPTVVGSAARPAMPDTSAATVMPSRPPVAPAEGARTTGAPRPATMTVKEPRRTQWPWWLLVVIVLCVGGYYGYQWWVDSHRAHLSEADAVHISKNVADDVKRFTLDNNPSALSTLYDTAKIDFFKRPNISRKAVLDELTKFTARIVRNEQYDVKVNRARAVNDSTIETEWEIAYQRMRNDSTLLRGSTANTVVLRRIDGQWLISSQQEKWTKRANVTPPKPVADTSGHADSMSVVDIAHAVDPETKLATVRMFLSMVAGGDANSAWDSYAGAALRSSAERTHVNADIAGQGYELGDVTIEGENVVARLSRSADLGPRPNLRIVATVVDEQGTPKIGSLRVAAP